MNIKPKDWLVIAIGAVIIIILVIITVRELSPNTKSPSPTVQTAPKKVERIVHIDGYDAATGSIITPLNVWKNYDARTFAFKIDHGASVTMLKKTSDGNGVYIRDASGREGWITYFFIEELK